MWGMWSSSCTASGPRASSVSSLADDLVEALRGARHIAVITGAGVSAESGIPTFRDAMEGLWAEYDPMQLATPMAFEADPELVTRWYDERRVRCLEKEPNAGHFALARLAELCAAQGRAFSLITQNVDRLHQRAGSADAIELHGSLYVWRCTTCGASEEQVGGAFEIYPPECGACGGMLRPGVVWFHEALPTEAVERAEAAARGCDVLLSVGTSAVVYPAAGLIDLARTGGAKTVEINRDETPISGSVDWRVSGLAGAVLPDLVGRVAEQGEDF